MKNLIYILIIATTVLCSCKNNKSEQQETPKQIKNDVIVLGTIHGGHLTQEQYSLEVLENLIREINPDIILTEIPPDRFPIAEKEFLEKDTITESRVSRFPEYVDVIFPLSKEMTFEIIPTAAWTKEMSDNRRDKLKEIKESIDRKEEWNELETAGNRSDAFIKASGKEHDPFWINSEVYDKLVEIELSVYNRLFNEELGPGGWDNINFAHYKYISEALNKYQFQGKRILITYGAGHKGWFLRELKKRDDINLLSLDDVVSKSD